MIKNGYATKDDLNRLEHNLKEEISGLKKDITNEMISLKVDVLGELKNIQENDSAHQFSHMRINDDSQELQTKVKKIETTKI
jgi:hypothetical protein